ncbi:hypothetical protein LTR53_013938 [Teratosphaeriaceae sp. CCFEE 6253]|nr:hypothetical protein LTR53_013938 [Teratosphaeriaceae sp. CCFEE 6253]
MASLESPIPAAAAGGFARDLQDEERTLSRASTMTAAKRWRAWRRAVGLSLLGVTVCLWTASNFLASTIFADDTYSKPYFVTYVNTSFFIIPLIPIVIQKVYQDPRGVRQYMASWDPRRHSLYTPLRDDGSADGSVYADRPSSRWRRQSTNASAELLLSDSMTASQETDGKGPRPPLDPPPPRLSIPATAKLSLEFCFLWFLANYFVAACLSYTTVASSTILTSTSSVFTLLFGALLRVERFTCRKLAAVAASLAGVALISSVDLSGKNTDDGHRGDFPRKSLREVALGDALALLSAVLYGVYAVVMKRRIADESRVHMPLFFGLVGLWNVCLLWPGFLVLHYTGAEPFALPPTPRVTLIILGNSAASLVADLAWAYAVLLTSPIVVTVGLSLTIPLSLVTQFVLHAQTASWVYWVGAGVVVLSFVFVSREEKEEEEKEEELAAQLFGDAELANPAVDAEAGPVPVHASRASV